MKCFILESHPAFHSIRSRVPQATNMKALLRLILAGCLLQVTHSPAAILYVDQNSTNATPPFTSWSTAATAIQDAVDAALAGDEIVVSNGVYATGGRVVFGSHTNRVVIDKPVTVRSLSGPLFTAIEGFPTNTESAVRCVYLTNGAALMGFTLTNGSTRNDGDYPVEFSGGGVYCESSAVVSNCVFTANSASGFGGGAFGGTLMNCVLLTNYTGWQGGGACSASLVNCTLLGNEATYGGGAYNSALTNCTLLGNFTHDDSDHTSNGGGASDSQLTNCVLRGNSSLRGGGVAGGSAVNCMMALNAAGGFGGGASGTVLINCTIISNHADNGGGVNACALTNCIVYFNTATSGTNSSVNNGSYYWGDSTFAYCDTTPLPVPGDNNISADPLLADFAHISLGSPCRAAGIAAAAGGADIDDDTWLNPPSMGCDEFYAGSATGALSVAISETFTNVATGFDVDFVAQISGHATANRWDFGDGTTATNRLFPSHSWTSPGNYIVTLTAFNTDHPAGTTTSVTIFVLAAPVHYVSLDGTSPVAPFTSWATAATNIQDCVDAAFAGGVVIVSNGVYQSGTRVLYGTMTNRVAVIKPLTLQSVNGAAVTVIDGGDMRCLYLSNRVSVTGFTLRNGMQANGAGVFCQTADNVLSDCFLSSNVSPTAWSSGGGAYGGVLNRCVIAGNSASYEGGGAAFATLNSCVLSNNSPASYGGGAGICTLNNCLVSGNAAAWGGGLSGCTVSSSIVMSNAASYGGGGSYYCTMVNSTVVGNDVGTGPGTYGGAGDIGSSLVSCVLYYNNGPNFGGFFGVSLDHCCTTPDPGGPRNITVPPLFVNLAAGNVRLQSNSPCINSGRNSAVAGTNDMDGLTRVMGGTVDIGAYEFQTPTSILSYAWAQQYGYPVDGSADYLDPDGDDMQNWQEWIAGTNPTNALSNLKMLPPPSDSNTNGITVTWQSVAGTYYFLQRSTNLAAPASFSTIQNDIYGSDGTTSFLDESATNQGPYFYRIGVR